MFGDHPSTSGSKDVSIWSLTIILGSFTEGRRWRFIHLANIQTNPPLHLAHPYFIHVSGPSNWDLSPIIWRGRQQFYVNFGNIWACKTAPGSLVSFFNNQRYGPKCPRRLSWHLWKCFLKARCPLSSTVCACSWYAACPPPMPLENLEKYLAMHPTPLIHWAVTFMSQPPHSPISNVRHVCQSPW